MFLFLTALATALAVATGNRAPDANARAFLEGSEKLSVKNGWREAGAPNADEFLEFTVVLEIRDARAVRWWL